MKHGREGKKHSRRRNAEYQAVSEGTPKINWTSRDLKSWRPKTATQQELVHDYISGKNVCCVGSAGTGKTFVSTALAMGDVLDPGRPQNRLIIVRSCVPSRDSGFLPGTQEEKAEPYEAPYVDIFAELFGKESTYRLMKEKGLVEFKPTSFLRGLTWDNCIILVDEPQNMTFDELKSVLTRVGRNSSILLCGDTNQVDLNKRKETSGLNQWISVFDTIRSFSVIEFTADDVVRSGLAKEIILALEECSAEDDTPSAFEDWSDKALAKRYNILMAMSNFEGDYCIPLSYEMHLDLLDIWDELINRQELKKEKDKSMLQLVPSIKPKTE